MTTYTKAPDKYRNNTTLRSCAFTMGIVDSYDDAIMASRDVLREALRGITDEHIKSLKNMANNSDPTVADIVAMRHIRDIIVNLKEVIRED